MSTLPNFHRDFKPYKPRPTATTFKPTEARKDWRVTVVMTVVVAVLAALAAFSFLPRAEAGAFAPRAVVLSGPITGFQQQASEIRVRIAATDQMNVRRRLIVSVAGPDRKQTIVPIGRGGDWVTVKLDGVLAGTGSLDVAVDEQGFTSGQVVSFPTSKAKRS